MYKYPLFFLTFFFSISALFAEENFLLINGSTNEVLLEMGPHVEERITPCSSFKIVLSLMGYDAGILKDDENPTLEFQEGYDDFLEVWKEPQTPKSWMQYSCVWYSKVLATQLGKKMNRYLASFEYGNQDSSEEVSWINSSLKISAKEQVNFIRKMIGRELPISSHAVEITKMLLFRESLPGGWKLFGKTGWSGSTYKPELGWFVGWIEKGDLFFPFAYNIREQKIDLGQRIPRVKELLECVYGKTDDGDSLRS